MIFIDLNPIYQGKSWKQYESDIRLYLGTSYPIELLYSDDAIKFFKNRVYISLDPIDRDTIKSIVRM